MKICIIKLGALGDVIRTLPILEAIKEKYPHSEITWITKNSSINILETNKLIDRIITIPADMNEKFDVLYNFDIEDDATILAKALKADKKYGFSEEGGYPAAFNPGSEYYLNTLFDDKLKKSNKKSYQEIMFNAAELKWRQQKIIINLSGDDRDYAKEFMLKNKIKGNKLIGIHIGSSPRWPSKAWSEAKIKEFILKAKTKGYEILLLAGPDDVVKKKNILAGLKEDISIAVQNPFCTLRQFAALVNLCSIIVCSDSLALHVSLAMKRPTIGLFFCTSPHEVEGYGLLKKIVSPMLKEFFPEKSDQYSKELVNSISAGKVLKEVEKIIK